MKLLLVLGALVLNACGGGTRNVRTPDGYVEGYSIIRAQLDPSSEHIANVSILLWRDETPLYCDESGEDGRYRDVPCPESRVEFRGALLPCKTQTDTLGRYSFSRVAPGTYRFALEDGHTVGTAIVNPDVIVSPRFQGDMLKNSTLKHTPCHWTVLN